MALTAARLTDRRGDESIITTVSVPVKASTKIYAGSLVVIDAGYAAPGRTATGLIAIGRAKATVDNSTGSSGAKKVDVERGCFLWENSASADLIAQADVGKTVYIVDDQTVALTSATASRSIAGQVLEIEPVSGKPFVEIRGF